MDHKWFNLDSLQYYYCCWCFFFRSDQQLSSHTRQYSRERSQRLACAISTKDDERPAGSVKLLYTYILSKQELDPKSWNMFCFQATIIRSKKMRNVKFDQMMHAWQQDMVQLMVFSSSKPFYRNTFKMHVKPLLFIVCYMYVVNFRELCYELRKPQCSDPEYWITVC